jgi:hypothetical protein
MRIARLSLIAFSFVASAAYAQTPAVMCYSLCWDLGRTASCSLTLANPQEQNAWNNFYRTYQTLGKKLVLVSLNNSTNKLTCPSNQAVNSFGGTRIHNWAPIHGSVLVTTSAIGSQNGTASITGGFVPSDAVFFPDSGAIK